MSGIELQGVAGPAAGTTDAQQQAKLVKGAHEFEAMLLNEFLKPLKFGHAESTEEGADETGGGQSDTICGFATEAMSKAIADHGGFGLAKQIVRQVTAEHDAKVGAKVGTKVW